MEKTTTMWVACYNKTFVTGLLKGLTVDAMVSYPAKIMAHKHINAVVNGGSDVITNSKWTASDCRVVPLAKIPLQLRSRHGLI